MSVLVKLLSPELPNSQIVFFRGFINLLVVYCVIKMRRIQINAQHHWILLGRGIAGFIAVSALFYSITHLPLPIAALLGWSSPLFVVIFSWWLIGERTSRASIFWILVAWVGVVIVLGPDWNIRVSPFSVLIGLVGSASAGLAYVAVRRVTRQVGVNVVIFWFTLIVSLCSLPGAWIETWNFELHRILVLIAMGLAATFGQYCMTEAYRHGPASEVSAMNLLNVAFSAGFGFWVFDEHLSAIQGLGLTVLGIGIWQMTRQEGMISSMQTSVVTPTDPRDRQFQAVLQELRALSPRFDWIGIYWLRGTVLELGPFLGAPTEHTRIAVGVGVCGTAVEEDRDQNIGDVTQVSNYLSCSLETRAELVILIRDRSGKVLGQIDIDSHTAGSFSEGEVQGVKKIAERLGALG